MSVKEFINQYYINPLLNPHTEMYNIYNTLTYGLVLAAAVFLLYKLLKKMNLKIDTNFFIATLPFIILASVLRVLRDADILLSAWFVAPVLYITVFIITFLALLGTLSFQLFSKIPYHKSMFISGILLLGFFSIKLQAAIPLVFVQILGITSTIGAALFALGKFSKNSLFSGINLGVLAGSMFDASSTFVGISIYGYIEKHVLPNFLISYTGAWIMFPLKFAVILLALYAIDNSEFDLNFKNFMKFAILCITVGPGARNTLRLAMGV